MMRLPRLVVPGIPYLVTQRGNRGAMTFFEDGDYALYRDLLALAAAKAGSQVWAYCLMPNHVHVIVVPIDEDGLRRTFADVHRRYTGYINARQRTSGHLWQGRFGAVAMDEAHLAHALRYVSLNPVRAGLVAQAQDWQWSSVTAHLGLVEDPLVDPEPVLSRYGDFAAFLNNPDIDEKPWHQLRLSETSGRPLGSADWLEAFEARTGIMLKPKKRGPKPKQPGASASPANQQLHRADQAAHNLSLPPNRG